MENIILTADQIRILLAVLDCSTTKQQPDWFYDEDEQVVETPFRDDTGAPYKARTLQQHLDFLLREESFPQIFDENYVEEEE